MFDEGLLHRVIQEISCYIGHLVAKESSKPQPLCRYVDVFRLWPSGGKLGGTDKISLIGARMIISMSKIPTDGGPPHLSPVDVTDPVDTAGGRVRITSSAAASPILGIVRRVRALHDST